MDSSYIRTYSQSQSNKSFCIMAYQYTEAGTHSLVESLTWNKDRELRLLLHAETLITWNGTQEWNVWRMVNKMFRHLLISVLDEFE
jgi:hypothetical protein